MIKRRRTWPLIGGVMFLMLGQAYGALAGVSGEYELRQPGELRCLSVNELKGAGAVQFSLYVEKGDFTGSLMGMAEMKGNTATYTTGGCQFTITFSDHKALIRHADTQCRDYLKPGVQLDGNYLKQP